MTKRVTAVRFFAHVRRLPTEMLVVWSGVVAFAAWRFATDQPDSGELVALLLFVQMFSASVGYRDGLRRGHFDPILVGPRARLEIALSHWLIAAAPGCFVWTVLLVAQKAIQPAAWTLASAGGIVAMLCVSVVTWSLSVPTTRYAGGTVWTAGIVILAGGRWIYDLHAMFEHGLSTWSASARAALAGLTCPFLLTAQSARPDGRTLLLTVALALVVWAAGAAVIGVFDAPLEETA